MTTHDTHCLDICRCVQRADEHLARRRLIERTLTAQARRLCFACAACHAGRETPGPVCAKPAEPGYRFCADHGREIRKARGTVKGDQS